MWEWLWNFFKKNMSFDLVATCVIVLILIYFLVTTEKKTYKFQGLNGIQVPQEFIQARPKTQKPKRVNKMEERCRDIFQNIFKRPFKSVRPDFLKNPVTKKNLELDGYCETIYTPLGKGIAFEYDGMQHSHYNPHFHKGGVDEFVYQTKKDSFKDQKCKEMGILLIRIPYYVVTEDLEKYIRDKLVKKGMRI